MLKLWALLFVFILASPGSGFWRSQPTPLLLEWERPQLRDWWTVQPWEISDEVDLEVVGEGLLWADLYRLLDWRKGTTDLPLRF